MSRFWKIALIVVAIIVVVAVGFRLMHKPSAGAQGKPGAAASADKNGGEKEADPVPVTVEPVSVQNVPVYLTALGTVQALNTVTVSPQIGGLLMKLNFDEGQEVTKGQVLAEIDPRSLQATYDEAAARRRQDAAQLATARSNLDRSRDLAKQGYISKQDLDTLQNTVSQYAAAVAADEAAANNAKVQLGYTKVIAPISGMAGIRGVDPGNIVTTASTIVTLTEVHPINVIFPLPEQNVELVRSSQQRGEPLEVAALDSTGNKVIAGKGLLKVINNQIDTSTGTFNLKAEFPNEENALFPGQFVNVRMKVNTVQGGLVIPSQAVQRGPDGDYVYQLQPADNTVKMQPVTTGQEVGDTHVMITQGLKTGDQVVTEGQFRLKPGSKVKPLKPGEVPKAPTEEELKKAAKDNKGGGRGRRG
ncbi:efflux RND transporter periplasmic adaptor subunit [Dyella sp.]|jgi:multidrug efflux system membrane fusion protein|uniref:efflux RND transporter periplasmic adaptor subunit n=1 Tax=Dyella sp. TaxID=1869338 RepID=UPI002D795A75|nr:efflux RND transporter periplasmic adaptor subunit [Dyella sp.]HET6431802.1 efflux RND transporter periplasmic adaptor subunit [Dyella sp.]